MGFFLVTIQALASIVIAVFACTTWRATSLYARISGISLIAEAIVKSTGADRDPKAYKDVLQLLKKDFPEEFEALKHRLPADVR